MARRGAFDSDLVPRAQFDETTQKEGWFAVDYLDASNVLLKTLTGALSFTSNLVSRALKTSAHTLTANGNLNKASTHGTTGNTSFVHTPGKLTFKSFSDPHISFSSTITKIKVAILNLGGAVSFLSQFPTRAVSKTLRHAVSPTHVLAKQARRSFLTNTLSQTSKVINRAQLAFNNNHLSSSGSITLQRAFLLALSGTVGFLHSLRRDARKVIRKTSTYSTSRRKSATKTQQRSIQPQAAPRRKLTMRTLASNSVAFTSNVLAEAFSHLFKLILQARIDFSSTTTTLFQRFKPYLIKLRASVGKKP